MSLDMELIKQKKKRKETASFHIGQEIINKICVSSVALGKIQIKQNPKTPMLAQTKAQCLSLSVSEEQYKNNSFSACSTGYSMLLEDF